MDWVINGAASSSRSCAFADLGYPAIDRVFDVNWRGTLLTIYGASKAAVKLMTEGSHSELNDTPVRVTMVFPWRS